MIAQAVVDALNKQINREFQASYLYLSMSADMDAKGFPGFSAWLRSQSTEETTHGMKLFDYVQARGGRVRLAAVTEPAADFGKPLDVAKAVLRHEQEVTQLINALYETAAREKDYVTAAELTWFLTEQTEEEKIAGDLVQRFELAGEAPQALLIVDRELGPRSG